MPYSTSECRDRQKSASGILKFSPQSRDSETQRSLLLITPFCEQTRRRRRSSGVREARKYGFASVCVNGYWVPLVASELNGSSVKVCSVAGFPLGAMSSEAKLAETGIALRAGAHEIDMVINVGALKSGERDSVQREIASITAACHEGGAILKVILETALLSDELKRIACQLSRDAGADFVKTSTGFGAAGAKEAMSS